MIRLEINIVSKQEENTLKEKKCFIYVFIAFISDTSHTSEIRKALKVQKNKMLKINPVNLWFVFTEKVHAFPTLKTAFNFIVILVTEITK